MTTEPRQQALGLVTIGQTPRDDFGEFFAGLDGARPWLRFEGALDGVDAATLERLGQPEATDRLVVRLADGRSLSVSRPALQPFVQGSADRLVARGADLITILCDSDWSDVRASRGTVIDPSAAIDTELGLWAQRLERLGLVVPEAGQALSRSTSRAISAHVRPFGSPAETAADLDAAARMFSVAGVDGVYLRCMGYEQAAGERIGEILGVPVITSATLLRRALERLLEEGVTDGCVPAP
jgi:AroM protein